MFALDELRGFDIPYKELNRVLGYKANNVVQGFTVLDADRSLALFEYLSLDSDLHPSAPTPAQLADRLADMPPGAEAEVDAVRRLEQGLLRRTLLPGAMGTCSVCGDHLPVQFLVAAHIKKRSECSHNERLDIPAVAMAACKFGCDALFEAGYLAVDEKGVVVVSDLAPKQGAAAAYLARVAGNVSGAFDAGRHEYYAWHRKHTYKRPGETSV